MTVYLFIKPRICFSFPCSQAVAHYSQFHSGFHLLLDGTYSRWKLKMLVELSSDFFLSHKMDSKTCSESAAWDVLLWLAHWCLSGRLTRNSLYWHNCHWRQMISVLMVCVWLLRSHCLLEKDCLKCPFVESLLSGLFLLTFWQTDASLDLTSWSKRTVLLNQTLKTVIDKQSGPPHLVNNLSKHPECALLCSRGRYFRFWGCNHWHDPAPQTGNITAMKDQDCGSDEWGM